MEPSPPRATDGAQPLAGGGKETTATPAGVRPPPPAGPVKVNPPPRRFDHYEVCLRDDGVTPHELGRGGMGVTYKALDVKLKIPVAVKVIGGAGMPAEALARARGRFQREARAAARLRHPNVASVFHFGETPAGEYFYAMEFIEGETLGARVLREGPLPPPLVIEIGLQVSTALMAAEEHGLVHRDLKPANLMLAAPPARIGTRAVPPTSRGTSAATPAPLRVKVIDFGLAKAVSAISPDQETEAPLTQAGDYLCTPAYASPEQAKGDPVDARSDIYSLGATLWFALTAQAPFGVRNPIEIYNRQMQRALPVRRLTDSGVPTPLVELLVRMLSPDPAERPTSPTSLHEELERCRVAPPATSRPTAIPPTEPVAPTTPSVPPSGLSGARIAAAALGILLVAGGGAFALSRVGRSPVPPPPTATPVPANDKSIAVLPLENLSDDQANAFFADGIHDDLLSSLAKISDLRVISRSSVQGYRNVATRNLRDISQTLGVANVLEGSVRRIGERVLVSVALVDARTGQRLWSERYDRTLSDALTLQGELATEIASALRATLSPEEKARVDVKPTSNAEAYVLYLRARDYQLRPNVLLQDYRMAERLYREAITLDPSFALARARLSAALAFVHENFEPSEELGARARAEAEESLRLRPDLGEGFLARGLCLYWVDKKYDDALRELQAAARLLPNSAEIDRYTGAIRRRRGQWGGAVESQRRALAADPRSAQAARELTRTLCLLRDWSAAERAAKGAVAIAPDNLSLLFDKCSIDFWSRGELAPLRAVLAKIPAGVDPDGVITLTRWEVEVVGRDWAAAEQAIKASSQDTFLTQFGILMPKAYFLGCIALARGDAEAARPQLEAACTALDEQARKFPHDAYRQVRLGVLHAYLGRRDQALAHGRRAVELLPEAEDTYVGPAVAAQMALICARVGEKDQALALIERLLRTPGGLVPGAEANMTRRDLRARWQWDLLRGDARFEKLLTGPEPKIAY